MSNETAIEHVPFDVDAKLQVLLDSHPLPAGVDDADLSMEGVAAAFSVSANTVGKWAKAGMPCIEQGGNGQAYVLRLSHCWAWRKEQTVQETAKAEKEQQAINQMQMAFLNTDGEAPTTMTARERKLNSDADFAQSRAAQARRQLIPLDDVVEILDAVCKAVRNGIEALPDRLERELDLKSEEVMLVERAGNDTLNTIARIIEEGQLEEREIGDMTMAPVLLN